MIAILEYASVSVCYKTAVSNFIIVHFYLYI